MSRCARGEAWKACVVRALGRQMSGGVAFQLGCRGPVVRHLVGREDAVRWCVRVERVVGIADAARAAVVLGRMAVVSEDCPYDYFLLHE